jgi:hypothetical protein
MGRLQKETLLFIQLEKFAERESFLESFFLVFNYICKQLLLGQTE